jgi:hypothetical protein
MKAEYEVLHTLNLPFIDVRKEPGQTVTAAELERAHQGEDDVKKLLRDKAIR